MIKTYPITLLVLLLCGLLSAQERSLEAVLQDIQEQIGEVQFKKETYLQTFSYEESAPYRASLTIEEVDSRGRSETQRFLFNLSFLDENLVRWESSRDEMQVQLRSGRDEVFKVYEDGELDGYEEEAVLYSPNVDKARALERLFREAIPLAEKAWEKDAALPEDFTGLRQWLAEEVGDVAMEQEGFRQKLAQEEGSPGRMQLRSIAYSEDGVEGEVRYVFGLEDLLVNSIRAATKGKTAFVELEIKRGDDFIEVMEEGELEYEDDLKIYGQDFEQAQRLAYALRTIVEPAEAAAEAAMPQPQGQSAILKALSGAVKSFSRPEEQVTQALEPACLTAYTRAVLDDDEEERARYELDLGDLNPKTVKIDVSRADIQVEAEIINGKDYILPYDNGEQENYDDELAIGAASIPNAKELAYLLAEAAKACRTELLPKGLPWLSNALETAELPGEDVILQEIGMQEDDPCKLRFKRQEDDEEELFEFNAYDMDAAGMEVEVKRDEVSLLMPTLRSEKTINLYIDGGELEFTDEISLMLPDIPTAKQAKATMASIVEGCQ